VTEFLLALGSAGWLGVMTSLSPCPLATNVAAISYLGREVGAPRRVVAGGLVYTAGRTVAYVALALLLLGGLLRLSSTSMTLQDVMNRLVGPVLLVAGVALLIRLRWTGVGGRWLERGQNWAARQGLAGALLLGALFALAFCPVSAGLFFGMLLPLSLQHESRLLMPLFYGIGTALPVVAAAIVIGYGSHSLAAVFDRVQAFERWARRVTAVVFVLIGLYMTALYTFGWSF
jgi:cytochrome c biogenesis protein CcdA